MKTAVQFRILSEPLIKSWQPPSQPYAVISIRSVGFEIPRIPQGPQHRGTLFMEFNDIREEEVGAISDAQAREILEFARRVLPEVELIVCQCGAGISRSAGTAAALAKIFTGDDRRIWEDDRYAPNPVVYKRILDVAADGGAATTPARPSS